MKCNMDANEMWMSYLLLWIILTYAGMQDDNVFGVSEYETNVADEEDVEDQGNEVKNC